MGGCEQCVLRMIAFHSEVLEIGRREHDVPCNIDRRCSTALRYCGLVQRRSTASLPLRPHENVVAHDGHRLGMAPVMLALDKKKLY